MSAVLDAGADERLARAHGSLLGMEPWEVEALADSLPPWDRSLDDDPAWLVPVSAVGLPQRRGLPAHSWRTEEVTTVQVADLRWCNQPWVRLDALAHYLGSRGHQPFDDDPWYGTEHPLVLALDEGLVVLDGVHRSAAARIRGQREMTASLVRPRRARSRR